VFTCESTDADNYAFVLAEKKPFAKDDFRSYLKNSVLSDKEYKEYLEEWNKIGFQDRWSHFNTTT
jgi:hypothetical protein